MNVWGRSRPHSRKKDTRFADSLEFLHAVGRTFRAHMADKHFDAQEAWAGDYDDWKKKRDDEEDECRNMRRRQRDEDESGEGH